MTVIAQKQRELLGLMIGLILFACSIGSLANDQPAWWQFSLVSLSGIMLTTAMLRSIALIPAECFVEFTDGETRTRQELRLRGEYTLKVDRVQTDGVWREAKSRRSFLSWIREEPKDTSLLYAVIGESFTLWLRKSEVGKLLLVGAALPLWNLKGTARTETAFVEPIELKSGNTYALQLTMDSGRVKSPTNTFRVDGETIYRLCK